MRSWGPAKIGTLGSSRRTSIFSTEKSYLETFPENNPNLPNFKMPSPAHLISRVGDPIFAAVIGLSAAATRINREEKELGHGTQQTIDAGLRYA
jgi:hypothetical protein